MMALVRWLYYESFEEKEQRTVISDIALFSGLSNTDHSLSLIFMPRR